MDRVQEAQVVDCGGRDEPTGVPLSRRGAAQVHEVHYATARNVSNQVRIIRQKGTGLANRATG